MAPKYRNILLVVQSREQGLHKTSSMNLILQRVAEEKAVCCELQETRCKLPTSVRSTFLMSFSPDSTKVASTHGDHKIYVCDVKSGKLLHKLEGHPRTPWCLAFHPVSNDILASGCLGGEVRVWHLHGGSEKWGADHNTVITSLAFHPSDTVLVIATFNQLHFWDWSLPAPFATCRTGSEREKVRFVKFDKLGNRLITGISNVHTAFCSFPSSSASTSATSSSSSASEGANNESNNANRNYRRATLEPIPPAVLTTPTSGSTLSHRRQLLTRLINVYQRIRGSLPETPRQGERSSDGERAELPGTDETLTRMRNLYNLSDLRLSQGSDSSDASSDRYRCVLHTGRSSSIPQNGAGSSEPRDSNDSDEDFLVRAFWRTFHRLRFCCTSLEIRIQQLQQTAEINASMPSSSASSSLPSSIPTSQQQYQSAEGLEYSLNPPSSTTSGHTSRGTNYLRMTSEFLTNTLTRFQNSLQVSAFSGAVSQDEIQVVQGRISEILERLHNVTGYRARLNTLREQIYEVAERSGRSSEDTSYIRSSDLAHCLWLIEMSLQLTQHLQRILHADYRLTQIHMNSSSPQAGPSSSLSSSSNATYTNVNLANVSLATPNFNNGNFSRRSCIICGNQNVIIPVENTADNNSDELHAAWHRLRTHIRQELDTVTERVRNEQVSVSSAINESRLLRSLNRMAQEEANGTFSGTRPPRERNSDVLTHFRNRVMNLFLGENLSSTTPSSSEANAMNTDSAANLELPGYEALERTLSESSDDDDISSGRLRGLILILIDMFSTSDLTRNSRWLNLPRQPGVTLASSLRSQQQQQPQQQQQQQHQQQSNFHLPEVNIVPSSSASDVDPLPVHERPRSPPLPTILSGSTDNIVSTWFSTVFDASNIVGPHESIMNYSHRVQSWDFSKFEVPEISNAKVNVVVPKCKIHNDASIDISKDGELLVALVPSSSGSLDAMMFAIYSLKARNLGHCLYNWAFDSNAISVSFSPLDQYIVIGLASPRLYLSSSEKEAVAQIFKLKFAEDYCEATHVRSLTQQGTGNTHHPGVSLNSVQWLPQPGQGLIYGTNRGCLSICKPVAPMTKNSYKNLKTSRIYEVGTLARDITTRRRNLLTLHRMFSAATQTIERGTQTTGTQTLGAEASSSSSSSSTR